MLLNKEKLEKAGYSSASNQYILEGQYADAFNCEREYILSVVRVHECQKDESWHSLDIVKVSNIIADDLTESDINQMCYFFRSYTGPGDTFERTAHIHIIGTGYAESGELFIFYAIGRSGGLDV